MSQSPDKMREPLPDFPNQDLNPLVNPVLGRHLERWAQVYFNTPAERREEAVFQLIEELKAEEISRGVPASGQSAAAPDETYATVCPHCKRSNERSQKYCGMCGALMPRAQAAAASGSGAVVGKTMFEQDFPPAGERVQGKVEERHDAEPAQRPRELESPFAATSLLFQPAAHAKSTSPEIENNEQEVESDVEYETADSDEMDSEPVDVDWLRDRNRYSEAEENSGIQNYLMGIAVVICVGILVFLIAIRPRYTKQAAKQKPPVNWNISQNAPTEMPSVIPSEGTPQAGANAKAPALEEPPQNQPVPMANPSPSANAPSKSKPSVPRSPSTAEVPAQAPAESNAGGAAELAVAKDYLSGKHGTPDGAAAARMLWTAISKKNGPALLLLSDLYASGNGVPKNCDQARLLVDAALRKDVPEADIKLRNLQVLCP